MTLSSVYRKISPIFRRKRFERFRKEIQPASGESMVDVGGYPLTWTSEEPLGVSIDILNIYEIDYDPAICNRHKITLLVGDGCQLPYESNRFDICFSNSVIEHVGTWENQVRFAREVLRVGKRVWVQTPAREFFIEPHYITPFVHWIPIPIRRRLVRHFTIWGWLQKPTPEEIEDRLKEIRLIGYAEMCRLFPGCQIIKEKFLGVFTKSYVAVRTITDDR